jgi:hypothetical protein
LPHRRGRAIPLVRIESVLNRGLKDALRGLKDAFAPFVRTRACQTRGSAHHSYGQPHLTSVRARANQHACASHARVRTPPRGSARVRMPVSPAAAGAGRRGPGRSYRTPTTPSLRHTRTPACVRARRLSARARSRAHPRGFARPLTPGGGGWGGGVSRGSVLGRRWGGQAGATGAAGGGRTAPEQSSTWHLSKR